MTDESGLQVPSINDLSAQFPHPLEQKPTPRDLANDLAVLNHTAHLAGDDVSSSPTTWRTTFPTSAWRRRSAGSPLSLPSCSPATRASLTATSSLSLR
eukprot:5212355-Pleurochrysis_carterae.AAC.1